MSEPLEIFIVGSMLIIGSRSGPERTASILSPAQVVAMPIPTGGGGLSMGWAVLPLPVAVEHGLQVPNGLDSIPRAVADDSMVKQYGDQLAEVRRRRSPLTLPGRH